MLGGAGGLSTFIYGRHGCEFGLMVGGGAGGYEWCWGWVLTYTYSNATQWGRSNGLGAVSASRDGFCCYILSIFSPVCDYSFVTNNIFYRCMFNVICVCCVLCDKL